MPVGGDIRGKARSGGLEFPDSPIPIPTLEEQEVANKNLKRSKELAKSLERMQKELAECTANGWLQVDKAKESKDDSS